MKRIGCAFVLCAVAFNGLYATKRPTSTEFFPFSVGTYWLYKGTVRYEDSEEGMPASTDVTWKMSVERVIRKQGLVAAVVRGYPSDLDWTAGTTEAKPWLILEDEKHRVFLENLGPEFDLSKLSGDERVFDKFLADDNLFFQWPMKQGAKHCDEESKKRDDGMYCWVVSGLETKKLETIKGAPPAEQTVYELQYRTMPDDTTVELVQGIGVLRYEYHHHGTTADTELRLVEFHPTGESPEVRGSEP